MDAGSIKDILFQLKGEVTNFFGVIGGDEGDKCTISIIAADSVIAEKGINAGNLVREVSKHIQGGGGGQAFFATAGGKNSAGLSVAIEELKSKI
jgi:alanyl-tRNA synthetase